jgi:hypothetical protein
MLIDSLARDCRAMHYWAASSAKSQHSSREEIVMLDEIITSPRTIYLGHRVAPTSGIAALRQLLMIRLLTTPPRASPLDLTYFRRPFRDFAMSFHAVLIATRPRGYQRYRHFVAMLHHILMPVRRYCLPRVQPRHATAVAEILLPPLTSTTAPRDFGLCFSTASPPLTSRSTRFRHLDDWRPLKTRSRMADFWRHY